MSAATLIDRYRKRIAALERAIKSPKLNNSGGYNYPICETCIYGDRAICRKAGCVDTSFAGWEFDEARFAGEDVK
jgi:hypothetical protein